MVKGVFLGKNIKKARLLKGYTQTDIGEVLKVPKQIVSRIEKDKRKLTDIELEKLSAFLGIPVKFLLEEKYIDDLDNEEYSPKNKWSLEVPAFIDDILFGIEEHFDYLIDSGSLKPKTALKLIQNTAKAFKLFSNEYKEKIK